MEKEAFKFSGEGAINYDKYLGPFLFEPYGVYVASLLPSDAQNILELAAGTGRVTNHLQQKLSSAAMLTATDISEDMLEVGKAKFENDKVKFMIADIMNLPFEDNIFDCVFCQFGIMFLPDKQKGFDEIYRVLKPGGKFIFTTWDKTESNEVLNIVFNKTLIPFFGEENSVKYLVPFSLHKPSELLSFLNNSNFIKNKVENVFLDGVIPSADELVKAFLTKHSLGAEVKAKDENAFEPLQTKLRSLLEEKFGNGKITVKLSAFICQGEK